MNGALCSPSLSSHIRIIVSLALKVCVYCKVSSDFDASHCRVVKGAATYQTEHSLSILWRVYILA